MINPGPGLRTLTVYTYAVLAMLFWGLSFVWFKQVINVYNPLTIITIRLLISAALMALFLFFAGKIEQVKKEDIRWFMLLAFTQPFCYFIGESFGLQMVSSTVSSVIISTIPLFTPIAAFLVLKENISREVLTGILFSFFGIVLMIVNPDLSIAAAPEGILLLFIAVFAAVAYSVVIKKLAFKYQPATIIMMQNLLGAVYFLPLFLIFDLNDFLDARPGRDVWIALAKLAFFASTLSYLFYIISIKEIGVVKANILTNLIPIITAVFSYFILDERFTPAKIAGMAVVMVGIILSQYRSIYYNLLKQQNKDFGTKPTSE